MAVLLMLGTPGSGKSYEATSHHVLEALKAGRKVRTNLPLNIEAFRELDPSYPALIEKLEPTAEKPIRFRDLEDWTDDWRDPVTQYGPLYVVDECQQCLPRRGTNEDVQNWFALHRHYGADVLLMTQSHGKVCKNVVDLVQTCYRLRKAVALGAPKTYVKVVLDGVGGSEISRSIRTYRKQFFRLYQSHTKSAAAVQEADVTKAGKWWMKWPFVLAMLAAPIGAYSIWDTVKHDRLFGGDALKNKKPVQSKPGEPTSQTTQAPQQEAVQTPAPPPKPKEPPSRINIDDERGGLEEPAEFPFLDVLKEAAAWKSTGQIGKTILLVGYDKQGYEIIRTTNQELAVYAIHTFDAGPGTYRVVGPKGVFFTATIGRQTPVAVRPDPTEHEVDPSKSPDAQPRRDGAVGQTAQPPSPVRTSLSQR